MKSWKVKTNAYPNAIILIQEQVVWAVQGGADYIIGETHSSVGEAEIALKVIKDFGQGVYHAFLRW